MSPYLAALAQIGMLTLFVVVTATLLTSPRASGRHAAPAARPSHPVPRAPLC